MKTSTFASLCLTLSALTMAAPGFAQQAQQARPAQTPAGDARTPAPHQIALPAETPPQAVNVVRRLDRSVLPQGFSVVLVLGDIQGAPTADDVPLAARRALTDMREFLPFKSYKLLDAAWLMCCGQDPRSGAAGRGVASTSGSANGVTQLLRGPDDQEYELKLYTSSAPGSQVFVRFTLSGSGSPREASAAAFSSTTRTTARRIADLTDQRGLLEKQIAEARRKVDVGIAPGTEVAKLELELRRIDREIADMTARLEEARGRNSVAARPSGQQMHRGPLFDTSFSMDVGETIVVGSSSIKGGSKALIALLTAVPPRGATGRRE